MIYIFTVRSCPKCEEAKKKLREEGSEYLEYIVNTDGTVTIPAGGAQDKLYEAWAAAKLADIETHEYPWAYDPDGFRVWSL